MAFPKLKSDRQEVSVKPYPSLGPPTLSEHLMQGHNLIKIPKSTLVLTIPDNYRVHKCTLLVT